MVADERFVGGVGRLLLHDGFGNFEADTFYVFEVAVVADTARYGEEYLTSGKVVVHERGGRYCLIRYDDHAEVDVLYGGVAEVDVDDEAFFPARQADEVAYFDGLHDDELKACEEVGERVLECDGDCHTADTEGGEDGGDGDVARLQDDHKTARVDDEFE